MSQVHALSDDQVGQELRKMTAFIKQEALEKAREIEIKANEEFSIEKSKLVRQETDSIDAAHAKRLKQAAMSQQITRSTVANKTRLKVLAARQQLLDDIFTAASKRLDEGTKDTAKYRGRPQEPTPRGPIRPIRARGPDAIKDAESEYKSNTDKETKVTVDEDNALPEGSSGGLFIVGGQGKIEINNTFDQRLLLLQTSGLPAVRETLFGKNPNRKFYD
ncbi:V-type proton ATPase subunit E [Daldinia childiae]|uniref:V-type proton ATPase subunit E n=1 Tax=Daldinia childiae TaxID=326645 RepID=UPI0014457E64|nr:V-type proton ATPase subunit E [Daldinia childiae]KAF3063994.1 V-type proton ATPase subunit E [Daldinia childiae]